MTRYIWRGGQFVHPRTDEPMPMPERDEVCLPQLMRDIHEYMSPVGSGLITSRSQRREDLKRHDCVEAPPRKHRGYKNPAFAKKHGLPLNEDR